VKPEGWAKETGEDIEESTNDTGEDNEDSADKAGRVRKNFHRY